MRRLRWAGLFLAPALLFFPAQAGAAKPHANKVRQTGQPIWTLGLDWPRVAYASGKEPGSETIHVWNVVTGATSVIESSRAATRYAAEIAIAGKRVAWLNSRQLGNTELDHWLYTAPLEGRAHLLKRTLGYTDTECGLGGPQMGGLIGSGSLLAVSTWKENGDGSVFSDPRLNRITPTGLRTIATGPDAILSESADGGHIAVLPFSAPSLAEGYCVEAPPASVDIYSSDGALLNTISLPPPDPSTLGYQVALSGNRLVVLTTGLYEPSGPATVTLSVFDWTSGALLHTWPVAIPQYPGEVSFSVCGHLAAVEGPYRLHLVDLDTGKDVTIAHTVRNAAIGARGLVYAVNPHNTGRLVFVPTAKLLAMVGS